MVLCLLVYRLAEYRLRARLAQTEQSFICAELVYHFEIAKEANRNRFAKVQLL